MPRANSVRANKRAPKRAQIVNATKRSLRRSRGASAASTAARVAQSDLQRLANMVRAGPSRPGRSSRNPVRARAAPRQTRAPKIPVHHRDMRLAEMVLAGKTESVRGMDPVPNSVACRQLSARAITMSPIPAQQGYDYYFVSNPYVPGLFFAEVPAGQAVGTFPFFGTNQLTIPANVEVAAAWGSGETSTGPYYSGNTASFQTTTSPTGIAGLVTTWNLIPFSQDPWSSTSLPAQAYQVSQVSDDGGVNQFTIAVSHVNGGLFNEYKPVQAQFVGGSFQLQVGLPYTAQASITTMNLQDKKSAHSMEVATELYGLDPTDSVVGRKQVWTRDQGEFICSLAEPGQDLLYDIVPGPGVVGTGPVVAWWQDAAATDRLLMTGNADLGKFISDNYIPTYVQGGGKNSDTWTVTDLPPGSHARTFTAGSCKAAQPPLSNQSEGWDPARSSVDFTTPYVGSLGNVCVMMGGGSNFTLSPAVACEPAFCNLAPVRDYKKDPSHSDIQNRTEIAAYPGLNFGLAEAFTRDSRTTFGAGQIFGVQEFFRTSIAVTRLTLSGTGNGQAYFEQVCDYSVVVDPSDPMSQRADPVLGYNPVEVRAFMGNTATCTTLSNANAAVAAASISKAAATSPGVKALAPSIINKAAKAGIKTVGGFMPTSAAKALEHIVKPEQIVGAVEGGLKSAADTVLNKAKDFALGMAGELKHGLSDLAEGGVEEAVTSVVSDFLGDLF